MSDLVVNKLWFVLNGLEILCIAEELILLKYRINVDYGHIHLRKSFIYADEVEDEALSLRYEISYYAFQDYSILIGDLGSDVTDAILQETFGSKFPSVKEVKVVNDATTGRSKGYGFVRFGDENERSQALTQMNGAYCSNKHMRINVATPRKPSGYQQQSQGSAPIQYPSSFMCPFFSYPLEELEERKCHIRIHGYVLKQHIPLGVILLVLLATAIEYSSIKE
ncbi:hypothetical protein GIB67_016616, partial [Kingdonia uniflora]